MYKLYESVKSLEQHSNQKYGLTESLMIENAAAALESEVQAHIHARDESVLVLCGSGNNGADGYALARRIAGEIPVSVYCMADPETGDCIKQREMAAAAGVNFLSGAAVSKFSASCKIVVDCMYGTGFHGVLEEKIVRLIEKINNLSCFRIACDVPSGIDKKGAVETTGSDGPVAFKAAATVTIGARKTALYSDTAKDFCGSICCADIGISSTLFESGIPDAYLLEASDMKLPVRTRKSVHKGNFGHAVVAAGEKEGAAVIAGTAALNFGAGLVSLVELFPERRTAFKMTPELMCGTELPANTTAVLLGSGLGRCDYSAVQQFVSWLSVQKKAGLVLDADMFYFDGIMQLLDTAGKKCPEARIVLTPHPKEFQSLLHLCVLGDYTIQQLSDDRLSLVKKFAARFPYVVLVLKGANTVISCKRGVFISTEGCPCLAKAGSGDVLAGFICALLAQGYTAEDAAITGVLAHGIASQHAASSYSMTPLKLIAAAAQL
jgi:ADP-dependent NAD(P)H-hydrate dehydratase / NAD(P)H-hydrate epimerase